MSIMNCSYRLWCALAAAGLGFLMIRPASVQQVNAAASEAMHPDTPFCVFGWSKDNCSGSLEGQDARELGCVRTIDGQVYECKTVYLQGASFKFRVASNGDGCDADARCDETPQLNGTLVLKGNFTFRKNESCPYRGCWSGEWELYDTNSQVIASGVGSGTLGTGSHRVPTCPTNTPCNPDCEKCYDVQYVPSTHTTGTWFVGVEGSLDGVVFAGPFDSSEICVTISGTLRTDGTPAGPNSFSGWRYCGTSDGVVLAKCEG